LRKKAFSIDTDSTENATGHTKVIFTNTRMINHKIQIEFNQLSKRDAVVSIDAAANVVAIVFADSGPEVSQEVSDQCVAFGFDVEEISSGLLIDTGHGYLASEVAELVVLALGKAGLKVDGRFPRRSVDGRLLRPRVV
jgi:hypothetical protein